MSGDRVRWVMTTGAGVKSALREPVRSDAGAVHERLRTITMEVGDIGRFKSGGNLASYCRAVSSKRTSNEKNTIANAATRSRIVHSKRVVFSAGLEKLVTAVQKRYSE